MPDALPDAFLPCPFCGGRASLAEGINEDGTPFQYIECDECRAMAETEWWNKRTQTILRAEEAEAKLATVTAIAIKAIANLSHADRCPTGRNGNSDQCVCGIKDMSEALDQIDVPAAGPSDTGRRGELAQIISEHILHLDWDQVKGIQMTDVMGAVQAIEAAGWSKWR